MGDEVTFIGFGEAGSAFAANWPKGPPRAYDRKIDSPDSQSALLMHYARADVLGFYTIEAALRRADAALCVVTADQALTTAENYGPLLEPGALWLDMNSVAPETKRRAAIAIEAAGGRYVDIAIMSPVHPGGRAVPLLVSGPHADDAVKLLSICGFTSVRKVATEVGVASAIKMVRSVMIKGLEALTTECVLAAEAAGVRAEVLDSLNASWPGTELGAKADYNLDRMIVHGLRRAAEMEEVVKTLDALGISSPMTRATVEWQRGIGSLELASVESLDANIGAVLGRRNDQAA